MGSTCKSFIENLQNTSIELEADAPSSPFSGCQRAKQNQKSLERIDFAGMIRTPLRW
jgi:hypothetical protein